MQKNVSKILLLSSILILIMLGILFYLLQPNKTEQFNNKTFLVVENLDVTLDISKLSINDVYIKLIEELNKKEFILYQNNSVSDTISFKDLQLKTNISDLIEEIKLENDSIKGFEKLKKHSYNITISYNVEKNVINNIIKELSCIKNNILSKDAYIIKENNELKIVKEIYGTEIKQDKFVESLISSINNGEMMLDIDSLDIYIKPNILSDDENLINQVNTYNNVVNTNFTYLFGEEKISLTKEQLSSWVSLSETNEIIFDDDMMLDYVKNLAKKYNTFGSTRKFKTTSGQIIIVPSGDYGWAISQTKEVKALQNDLLLGQDITREPTWLYKGYGSYYNKDGCDINNSYVEIDLSTQHLWLYVDGELITDTDFVSGKKSCGWDTPSGVFGLTYKQKNATLRGAGYATPVKYWMPFNMNIGMHDATWRNSFGGNIYINNGSHGCINLPLNAAKIIYSNIDTFFPVVVYDFEELT